MNFSHKDSCEYIKDYRKLRTKNDWACVNIGDAFKHNIDYYSRLQAQRKFYQLLKKVQLAIARQTGTADPETPRVKPQLSTFYTSYPSGLSAYSAIGLTSYLEFEARVKEKVLLMHLTEYLKDPAEADNVRVDPKIYRELAVIVTKSVQTRLLLEDLSHLSSLTYIEYYRLFSASQQAMKFRSMPEIINAIILYGDILPDWKGMELHPMTRALFSDITTECIPFFSRLPHIKPEMILEFGAQWVRSVCLCLVKYLPEPEDDNTQNTSKDYKSLSDLLSQKSLRDRGYLFKNEAEQWLENNKIAPLNAIPVNEFFKRPPE